MKKEGIQPSIIDVANSKIKVKTQAFISVLALVSIAGFGGIVGKTLFNLDITNYIEISFMVIIGIGLIIEARLSTFSKIKIEGLTPTNFTHLITIIVGFISILAGLLSLPLFGIDTPGFHAVKGIISVIAIIIIIIQTWIVR